MAWHNILRQAQDERGLIVGIAFFPTCLQTFGMKNIQIIDGASNATFSIFQATDEEFVTIFPNGQDMEIVEDFISRVGEDRAGTVLAPIWDRPILKRDAMGIQGTLFYDTQVASDRLPSTKREVDWDEGWINQAQRELFRLHR